jgi:hypothetical protein
MEWVTRVGLPSDAEACRRDALVAELDHFERLLEIVTDRLDRLASDHPGVALLMTIPGVGPRTAEAVVAYIDDPSRFGSVRCVGSYFGLVPKQDQSARAQPAGADHQDGPGDGAAAAGRGGVERVAVVPAGAGVRRAGDARRPGPEEDRDGGPGPQAAADDAGDAADGRGVPLGEAPA